MKTAKKKAKTKRYFKCDVCGKKCMDRRSLGRHVAIHSDETPYKCTQCDYAGKTQQYLSTHIKMRHKRVKKNVTCKVCGKDFYYESSLKGHMLVHTGEKPYKCMECDKAFNSSYSLKTHSFIHSDLKPFKCTYCPYACRDSSTLRKHKERHTGRVKCFTCSMCNVSYASKPKLKIHIAEKHFDVDVRRMECHYCGKRFKCRQLIISHIRCVHEKSRTVKCEVCGKTLANKSNMRTHLRTHVDQRPYKCEFEGCDRRFKDTSSRSKHSIRHYPERQFPCKICDKLFLRKERLRKHLNTHMAKVKKEECDYCGVRFYNKNYLTTHIQRKHGRKKQKYVCDLCGLVTTNKPSIVMHIKYGHGDDKELKCNICDKPFKRDVNLKLHYWMAHEMEYNIPGIEVKHKKKKKKTEEPQLEVKVEPIDNEYESERFLNVTPKIEPLDDEGLQELTNVVPEPEVRPDFPDMPTDVYEEFITPAERGRDGRRLKNEGLTNAVPESEVRPDFQDIPTAVFEEFITPAERGRDGRRLKNDNEFIDKKAAKQVKRKIDDLMEEMKNKQRERKMELRKKKEERARKLASRALERTRRKYNRLIRIAIQNSLKKDKIKIKHGAISAQDQPSDSLLEPNFFIKQTIDSRDRVLDVPFIDNIENRREGSEEEDIDNNLSSDEDKDMNTEKAIDNSEENKETEKDIYNKLTLEDQNPINTDNGNYKSKKDKEIDERMANESSEEEIGVNTKNRLNNSEEHKETENNMDSNLAPQEKNDINTDNINANEIEQNKNEAGDDPGNEMDGVEDKDSDTDRSSNGTDDEYSIKASKTNSGGNRKLKFNTHQCYVCFKLYQTSEELIEHCKEHFDLSNMQTLKKCPICEYTTNLSITTHLKRKHNIKIKLPFGSFKYNKEMNGTKYYYEVDDARIKKLEIIPGIKNLNKRESCKIDKKNRDKKNKDVLKSKLVKKGKEWIVMKEKVKINFKDCLLPKYDNLKSDVEGSYVDRLKELYKVAKKNGNKMVFPCDGCDKICQTLAALRLHGRKHELNPKPFKAKVWKHKLKGKIDKVKSKNVTINKENRTAKPKPVVNKHKCDKELIEFYNQNIKGGDIEFWQFLKIYNKMERENVNDFEDLQKSTHFGIHTNESIETTNFVNSNESNVSNLRTDNRNESSKSKYVKIVKNNPKGAFTRVVRLSKSEMMKRNEARRKLREKMKLNSEVR